MPNLTKASFLSELEKRYGPTKKLTTSLSLFEVSDGLLRIYVRYSMVHAQRKQAFYGLRKEDLKELQGHNSVICFLWDRQLEPLFLPFSEFEDILDAVTAASDGQIKASIFQQRDATELYLANTGRFNVEAFFGWKSLERLVERSQIVSVPEFSHSQIQTLIGSIGVTKGYDVWVPLADRNRLDWRLAPEFNCRTSLPDRYSRVIGIISEVDVMWLQRGSSELKAMFEVEHSTPVYSGLLRFNDLYLTEPNLKLRYSIVSNDERRSLFLRQIDRPTFKASGLSEICSFLEYKDVFLWFNRTLGVRK